MGGWIWGLGANAWRRGELAGLGLALTSEEGGERVWAYHAQTDSPLVSCIKQAGKMSLKCDVC